LFSFFFYISACDCFCSRSLSLKNPIYLIALNSAAKTLPRVWFVVAAVFALLHSALPAVYRYLGT
jgi:hypothetical protein